MELSLSNLWFNTGRVIAAGLKDWGGLHAVIVHFPIALLFFAPLLILAGLFFSQHRRGFFLSALILMLAGLVFTQLSIVTGNAAAEFLEADPAYVATLDAHVQLAERSRISFSVLSGVFLLFCIFHPKLTQKFSQRGQSIGLSIYVLLYLTQLVVLFNAAHQGARLVHEHGLTSTLFSNLKEQQPPPSQ